MMKKSMLAVVSILVLILLALGAFTYAWFAMRTTTDETILLTATDDAFVSFDVPTGIVEPTMLTPAKARADALVNGIVFTPESVKNAGNISQAGGLISVANQLEYSRTMIYYGENCDVQVKARGALYYETDDQSADFQKGVTVSDSDLAISIVITQVSNGAVVAPTSSTDTSGVYSGIYALNADTLYQVSLTVWFARVDEELDWDILNAGDLVLELGCALLS